MKSSIPSPLTSATTSEHCLTLSVDAPYPLVTNAPVIVFIYGGAFEAGSSSSCPAMRCAPKRRAIDG